MRRYFPILLSLACLGCTVVREAITGDWSKLEVYQLSAASGLDVRVFTNDVPLPGAEIRVTAADQPPFEAFSDVEGKAHFDIAPGEWCVNVSLEGLLPVSGTISVESNKLSVAEASLVVRDWEPVTIVCPPPFWSLHAPGVFTTYNSGKAWPEPW